MVGFFWTWLELWLGLDIWLGCIGHLVGYKILLDGCLVRFYIGWVGDIVWLDWNGNMVLLGWAGNLVGFGDLARLEI